MEMTKIQRIVMWEVLLADVLQTQAKNNCFDYCLFLLVCRFHVFLIGCYLYSHLYYYYCFEMEVNEKVERQLLNGFLEVSYNWHFVEVVISKVVVVVVHQNCYLQ